MLRFRCYSVARYGSLTIPVMTVVTRIPAINMQHVNEATLRVYRSSRPYQHQLTWKNLRRVRGLGATLDDTSV